MTKPGVMSVLQLEEFLLDDDIDIDIAIAIGSAMTLKWYRWVRDNINDHQKHKISVLFNIFKNTAKMYFVTSKSTFRRLYKVK